MTTLAQLLAPFVPFIAERLWQDLVVGVDASAPDSVHLTDFPTAPDAWRDADVVAAMATARRLVELGRQARTDSGQRIRQPLARALVGVPAREAHGLTLVAGEIADELNLHAVEVADGSDGVVDRSLRPNFRALGPAFGSDAPKVAAALSALDSDGVEALLSADDDGTLPLVVDGTSFPLSAEMFDVVEMPRTGWSVARDGAYAVALDTRLTPELEVEGAARELVRGVNEHRKAVGLDLADRIVLEVSSRPEELIGRLAAAGHLDAVAREVLATTVTAGTTIAPDGPDVATIGLGALGTASVRIRRA